MFTRVKPLGWAFLEILTSTQMNQLDTNVSRAIDGLNGGTYALAVMLELAGAGVKFSTVAEFNAAAVNFVGATVNVDSGSTWTFDSTVLFNALVAFSAGAIVPNLATLAIQSGGTLNNNAGGTIVNQGTLQNSGIIQNTSSGRLHRRGFNLSTSTDSVVTIADGEVFMFVAGGAAHIHTLSGAGAQDDDEVEFRQTEFHTTPNANQVRINPTGLGPPSGGNIITFGVASDPIGIKAVRCRRRAGTFDLFFERYGPL